MSATTMAVSDARAAGMTARASFRGLLRGEMRKIARLRVTWAMAGVYTLFVVGAQLLLAANPTQGRRDLLSDPLPALYNVMQGDLSIPRMLVGVFLLILAAHAVGIEYQQGTIRILLGRGVGRLQLLSAETTAVALAGLALLAWGLLIEGAFAVGIVVAQAGDARPWLALDGTFWANAGLYVVCVLISMAATLLLGVAAAAVGRTLAIGLAVGLSWFAVDNLATLPLSLAARFTGSDVWLRASGFLLGPLLNRLPDYVIGSYRVTAQGPGGPTTITHRVDGFGILPLTHVDAVQALAVIAAYAVIFAAAAIVTTRRRDVLE